MRQSELANEHLQMCIGWLVKTGWNKTEAAQLAAREVPFFSKADASGTAHSDMTGSFVSYVNGLFLSLLEHSGGAYEFLKQNGRRYGFNERIFIPSTSTTASIVDESGAIPVSAYVQAAAGLTPVKAAALAVASNESLENGTGTPWLVQDLVEGMTKAVDAKVAAVLKAAVTPATATTDPIADIKTLVTSVNQSGSGKLAFLFHPTVASILSTWAIDSTSQNFVFPDLSPTGGLICGVPAIVTAGVPSDEMYLVDALGCVSADRDVEIALSQQAAIEMDTAPASDSQTPVAATGKVVNMFQTECTALKAVRSFAVKVARSSSVHALDTIAWGS